MKLRNVIVILLFVIVSQVVNAQRVYDTYRCEYFGETYDIMASNDDAISVYIQVMGENSSDEVYVNVEERDIPRFRSALSSIKTKYAEWRRIAINNDVKSYGKDFDVNFPKVTIAWKGSKYYFEFNYELKPRFIVTDNGDIIVSCYGKATASSNEYITEEFYFVLSNEREIDALLRKVNIPYINSKLQSRENLDDLFL